jgi:hypothetical protein
LALDRSTSGMIVTVGEATPLDPCGTPDCETKKRTAMTTSSHRPLHVTLFSVSLHTYIFFLMIMMIHTDSLLAGSRPANGSTPLSCIKSVMPLPEADPATTFRPVIGGMACSTAVPLAVATRSAVLDTAITFVCSAKS